MIDKYYRCDLCHASCAAETLDKFLIGLHWTDFPIHGWIQKPARETEHHICKTCLISLQTIGENKKPMTQAVSNYKDTDPIELVRDVYDIMRDGDGLSPEKLVADVVEMLREYLSCH